MTRRNFMMATVAVLFGTAVSSADEQKQLQESLKTWQQLSEQNEGNYSYTVRWSSFVGFGHETEIIVRDNKVVERRYRTFSNRPPASPAEPAFKVSSWVEKGKSLGTHKEGAPPKTIDELYAEAAKVLERPLSEHERRYVRFDQRGLLLSCFTVDARIADDAPREGVMITRIQLGTGNMGEVAGKTYKAPNGKPFPAHWGEPPRIQTRDIRPLPGGYGRGSGTLANWIQKNLDRDANREAAQE